jgi:SAM-dependent methyltransferase
MINWHDRYAKLLARERGLFDVHRSVLEVGCGPWGIALWLQRPVVGLERDALEPLNPLIDLVRGDVLSLPFDDASFDNVVCADVLEHLPEGDRAPALAELVRVTREKLLVTCPCGCAAEQGEAAFAALHDSLGVPPPTWLTEHLEHGLPQVGSLLEALMAPGFAVEVTGNESRMQHFGGLLLDIALPAAAGWNAEHAAKTVLEPPIGESPWDRYYSYLFTVDKNRRRPAAQESPLPSPSAGSDEEPTWAIHAVVHDPSLMDDIAPIGYVCTGAAASASLPPLEPRPLVAADHLSDRRWSELRAVYSVWKEGPVTDVVGFCHYRRFLDFGPRVGDDRQRTIARTDIPVARAAFSPAGQIPRVAAGAMIVAMPVDLGESVFEHYGKLHSTNDYLLLLDVLGELRPELLPFMLEDFTSPLLYCNNLFVMNWGLFDRLCETWFPVLQGWCARVDAGRASDYQDRDVSFLSERLFSAWVKFVCSRGVEVDERPVIFVETGLPASRSAAEALALAHRPAAPLSAGLRRAETALESERAQRRALEGELESERAQRRALEGELARRSDALAAEQAALARVAASTSWRLTAPLREAGRVARTAAEAARRRAGGPS